MSRDAWREFIGCNVKGAKPAPGYAAETTTTRAPLIFEARHFVAAVLNCAPRWMPHRKLDKRGDAEAIGESLRARDVIRPALSGEDKRFVDDSSDWVTRAGEAETPHNMFSVAALLNSSTNYVLGAHFMKQGTMFLNSRYFVLDRSTRRLYVFTHYTSTKPRYYVDFAGAGPITVALVSPDPTGTGASASITTLRGDAAAALMSDDTDTSLDYSHHDDSDDNSHSPDNASVGSLSSSYRTSGRKPSETLGSSLSSMSTVGLLASLLRGKSENSSQNSTTEGSKSAGFIINSPTLRLAGYTSSHRRAKVWVKAMRACIDGKSVGRRSQSHTQLLLRSNAITGDRALAIMAAPSGGQGAGATVLTPGGGAGVSRMIRNTPVPSPALPSPGLSSPLPNALLSSPLPSPLGSSPAFSVPTLAKGAMGGSEGGGSVEGEESEAALGDMASPQQQGMVTSGVTEPQTSPIPITFSLPIPNNVTDLLSAPEATIQRLLAMNSVRIAPPPGDIQLTQVQTAAMLDLYVTPLELFVKNANSGNTSALNRTTWSAGTKNALACLRQFVVHPLKIITDLGVFLPSHQYYILSRCAALLPMSQKELELMTEYHQLALATHAAREIDAACAFGGTGEAGADVGADGTVATQISEEPHGPPRELPVAAGTGESGELKHTQPTVDRVVSAESSISAFGLIIHLPVPLPMSDFLSLNSAASHHGGMMEILEVPPSYSQVSNIIKRMRGDDVTYESTRRSLNGFYRPVPHHDEFDGLYAASAPASDDLYESSRVLVQLAVSHAVGAYDSAKEAAEEEAAMAATMNIPSEPASVGDGHRLIYARGMLSSQLPPVHEAAEMASPKPAVADPPVFSPEPAGRERLASTASGSTISTVAKHKPHFRVRYGSASTTNSPRTPAPMTSPPPRIPHPQPAQSQSAHSTPTKSNPIAIPNSGAHARITRASSNFEPDHRRSRSDSDFDDASSNASSEMDIKRIRVGSSKRKPGNGHAHRHTASASSVASRESFDFSIGSGSVMSASQSAHGATVLLRRGYKTPAVARQGSQMAEEFMHPSFLLPVHEPDALSTVSPYLPSSMPPELVDLILEAHAKGAVHALQFPESLPKSTVPTIANYSIEVANDSVAKWAIDLGQVSATLLAGYRMQTRDSGVNTSDGSSTDADSWWYIASDAPESGKLLPEPVIAKTMELIVLRLKTLLTQHAVGLLLQGRHPMSLLVQRVVANFQTLYCPQMAAQCGLSSKQAVKFLKEDMMPACDRMVGLMKEWPKQWTMALNDWGAASIYLSGTRVFKTACETPSVEGVGRGAPAFADSKWYQHAQQLFGESGAFATCCEPLINPSWRYLCRLAKVIRLGDKDCEEVARDALHAVVFTSLSTTIGHHFRTMQTHQDTLVKRVYKVLWGITTSQLGVAEEYQLDKSCEVSPMSAPVTLAAVFCQAAVQLRLPMPVLHPSRLAQIPDSRCDTEVAGTVAIVAKLVSSGGLRITKLDNRPASSNNASVVMALPPDATSRAGRIIRPAPIDVTADSNNVRKSLRLPEVDAGLTSSWPDYAAGESTAPAALAAFQPAIDVLSMLVYCHEPYQKLRVIATTVDVLCKCITEHRHGLATAMRARRDEKLSSDGASSVVDDDRTIAALSKPAHLSADELLSLLCFLAIHSGVEGLTAQLHYTFEYIHHETTYEKAGFYATTLMAACEYMVLNGPKPLPCGHCEGLREKPCLAVIRCRACGRQLCPDCDAKIHNYIQTVDTAMEVAGSKAGIDCVNLSCRHLRVPAPTTFFSPQAQYSEDDCCTSCAQWKVKLSGPAQTPSHPIRRVASRSEGLPFANEPQRVTLRDRTMSEAPSLFKSSSPGGEQLWLPYEDGNVQLRVRSNSGAPNRSRTSTLGDDMEESKLAAAAAEVLNSPIVVARISRYMSFANDLDAHDTERAGQLSDSELE